jgi:ribosome-associated protein
MNITKLQRLIVDALEDIKGQDIEIFNVTQLTPLFDRVIIASGTSNRQTRALAMSVRDKVKQAGGTVISIEGEESGEWVLIDCGDAVVHIMQPSIRAYYRLEEIWGGKTVHIKRQGMEASEAALPATKTVKAPRKSSKPATAPVRKKVPSKKTA